MMLSFGAKVSFMFCTERCVPVEGHREDCSKRKGD